MNCALYLAQNKLVVIWTKCKVTLLAKLPSIFDVLTLSIAINIAFDTCSIASIFLFYIEPSCGSESTAKKFTILHKLGLTVQATAISVMI